MLWVQARSRFGVAGPPAPEPSSPAARRAARVFQGVGLLAWLLGMVAFVGASANEDLLAALVPAGVLLIGLGVAFQADVHDVRAGLSELDRRSWSYRTFGTSCVGRWLGAGLAFIGLCWIAVGAATVLT